MHKPRNYLIDMDGVLVSGSTLIPGADQFIENLKASGSKFLVLTNNSRFSPRDLAHNLHLVGLEIPPESIFTSAMATARFLQKQKPRGMAFVIGESGLTSALHNIGYIITEHEPDYVVLGETTSYNMDMITKAVRLITAGARFIATNPDPSGPSEAGITPGCGALAALIERATQIAPFFVGKPNPLMMRMALNYLGVHSENTVIIGDRMDTDMVAGVQTGMDTILVLSGITRSEDIERFPYVPTRVAASVADLLAETSPQRFTSHSKKNRPN
ncbi:MAG: HAD family hydrolase [Chloroflexi bacterium]|nr:HAD family hydrolase [Chloroflexota bacterium]